MAGVVAPALSLASTVLGGIFGIVGHSHLIQDFLHQFHQESRSVTAVITNHSSLELVDCHARQHPDQIISPLSPNRRCQMKFNKAIITLKETQRDEL